MTLLNLNEVTRPFTWEQAKKYIDENDEVIIDKVHKILIYSVPFPLKVTVTQEGQQEVTWGKDYTFYEYEKGEFTNNPPYSLFTGASLDFAFFDKDGNIVEDVN